MTKSEWHALTILNDLSATRVACFINLHNLAYSLKLVPIGRQLQRPLRPNPTAVSKMRVAWRPVYTSDLSTDLHLLKSIM